MSVQTFRKILLVSIMAIPWSGLQPSIPGDIDSHQTGDQTWYFASRMMKTPRVVEMYMRIAHRPWHVQRSKSSPLIGTAGERTAKQEGYIFIVRQLLARWPLYYHWKHIKIVKPMMTSSNGNIFSVTGPLRGEFTGHRWIPRTKASDAELGLNKRLSKPPRRRWFGPSRPLSRHWNGHPSKLTDTTRQSAMYSYDWSHIKFNETLSWSRFIFG